MSRSQIKLELLPKNFYEISDFGKAMDNTAEVQEEPIAFNHDGEEVVAHFWNDGAGQSAGLYISSSSKSAMLMLFDHESNLNFYADEFYSYKGEDLTAYEMQSRLYEGVPNYLRRCVEGQDELYSFFNIISENNDKIFYASTVILFQNGNWELTPFSKELLKDEDYNDVDFNYIIEDILDL